MSKPPVLTRLEFVFQLEGEEPETVVVRSRSTIQWDETRAKRKWPTTSEAPMLWQAFVCWHALTREGRYTGDFDTFKDQLIGVEGVDDEAVDPTRQDELAT